MSDIKEYKQIETIQDVLNIVQELQKERPESDLIFRGENKCYPCVNSTLYREQFLIIPQLLDQNNLPKEQREREVVLYDMLQKINFSEMQMDRIKDARNHYPTNTDLDIATELQHYGGKTNLIDFTKDILIALFFACDGEHKKNGRVIILDKNNKCFEYTTQINLDNIQNDLILESNSKNNRVVAQKSIFVMPKKGYIERDKFIEILIPSHMKNNLLVSLYSMNNINAETVYNDIHGFIANNNKTRIYYTYLYLAKMSDRLGNDAEQYYHLGNAEYHVGKYKESIALYSESIKRDKQYIQSYFNRGVAKSELGDNYGAIKDYCIAIKLSPKDYQSYYNRGIAYTTLGKKENNNTHFETALRDFKKALDFNDNNDNNADIYNNLGSVKMLLGYYEQKRKNYNKAKTYYEQAIEYLTSALKINQNHSKAKNDLELAKELLKQLEQQD